MGEYIMTSERFFSDETDVTVWTNAVLNVGDTYKMDGINWFVVEVVRPTPTGDPLPAIPRHTARA